MNEFATPPPEELGLPVESDPNWHDFLELREISPEDYPLLEELRRFPKSVIYQYHNVFNSSKERATDELKVSVRLSEEKGDEGADDLAFMKLLLQFSEKYHWTAGYNLIRVLERTAQY